MLVWVYLILAGIFEVVWAVALKYSNSFTNFKASVVVIIGMIISFYFLSLSMKSLSISLAYPIWTAIGAIGTAVFGMVFMGDSVSTLRIFFLFVVIVGVIGLKISSCCTSSKFTCSFDQNTLTTVPMYFPKKSPK